MGDNNDNNNYDNNSNNNADDVADGGEGSLQFVVIDPLQFSFLLFGILVTFVLYLLLPRGVRKQYFGSYPKRHAWSARGSGSSSRGGRGRNNQQQHPHGGGGYGPSSVEGSYTGGSSVLGGNSTHFTGPQYPLSSSQQQHPQQQQHLGLTDNNSASIAGTAPPPDDEIVLSAAMQQLRDPGVLIVAHGSRGKPKTVRLQLTETAITWRTETRKSNNTNKPPKLGKLHQVPLSHIMYVDVGKQTTALRRVENAAVPETLCFSLLTKEGSLDLEANSPRERDALVNCFSLVLDEVHKANWRDIYRGPSSDMPSSFDEADQQQQTPMTNKPT